MTTLSALYLVMLTYLEHWPSSDVFPTDEEAPWSQQCGGLAQGCMQVTSTVYIEAEALHEYSLNYKKFYIYINLKS